MNRGKLQQWRLDRGLTQKALAEELGIPLPTYRSYEQAHRVPPSTVKRYFDVMFWLWDEHPELYAKYLVMK